MDQNYQTYLNRIMRTTLPETYQSQVQYIHESPKFLRSDSGDWQPADFPGYTIITPPGSIDKANQSLYQELATYQQTLLTQLGTELFIPVPAESFHLTIADLIWESSYRHAADQSNFEHQLQTGIAQSFQQSAHLHTGQPIPFRVVGLMVMTRALGVALAATDEGGYNQIVELRRSIYQNSDLIAIGIEQQYHFTPHITLGYFGSLVGCDLTQLGEKFDQLNQPWLESQHQPFWVKQAELRKFPDMTRYDREEIYPIFEF
ncbi:MAG: DUF1868 domain-containing protein [Synechococcales bacterium]|nr:DUF1868 domain-containing protein [Synechococcales bacterium]